MNKYKAMRRERDLNAVEGIGPRIDDHVWFADRSHGRMTEHLATVIGVDSPTVLKLKVIDQGEARVFETVSPWNSDSICGWWKV